MHETSIVIVGGGAAGLSTAGALKQRGLSAVVLDKDECIGGTWARRYDRLRLHTLRRFSGLAHHPLPKSYPRYVPKDLFAQYLQDYARHFELDIRLRCNVERISREHDAAGSPWIVESSGGPWRCKVVVIASGQYSKPVMPSWPGVDTYRGRLLHSADYRSGREYAGKRTLVIGAGNSGTEIATDLVEQGAAAVAISVRTPPTVVPRDLLGIPVQLSGILLSALPPRWADRLGTNLSRLVIGDLSRYGLAAPGWHPFSARRIPTIDVGFVRELKRGRVQIRPPVARFTPEGVVYDDGREESVDAVIAATGFTSGLKKLLDLPGLLDEHGYPLYSPGRPTPYPGLFFMGYTYSLRGHLYEVNCDSRRLAKIIARYLAG
ncbi:MAG: monooxygenase [Herpetosiphonaceae bacterium]|nr:MAG: monooxygenase [Herpetosiphonaceae bacterium]